MEGYLSARIMTEALKRMGKNPSREGLVTAFESLKLNFGGFLVGYSPQSRTGSEFVDLTTVLEVLPSEHTERFQQPITDGSVRLELRLHETLVNELP